MKSCPGRISRDKALNMLLQWSRWWYPCQMFFAGQDVPACSSYLSDRSKTLLGCDKLQQTEPIDMWSCCPHYESSRGQGYCSQSTFIPRSFIPASWHTVGRLLMIRPGKNRSVPARSPQRSSSIVIQSWAWTKISCRAPCLLVRIIGSSAASIFLNWASLNQR